MFWQEGVYFGSVLSVVYAANLLIYAFEDEG
jgi:hypothetical protein